MKKIKLFISTVLLTLSMSITALAGSWQAQETGQWKYQNDDGSYVVSAWQWIDGNGDGVAENYYFDASGFCLMNTTAPDGNSVDADGAWVIDGVIQTQTVTVPQAPKTSTTKSDAVKKVSGISSSPYDGYTIIVNTGTKKYHVPGCKSVAKMKTENTGYCSDSSYLETNGYSACKNCH